MTLQCQCGSSALVITEQNYPAESGLADATESYECKDCGRTGTIRFDSDENARKDGCLTSMLTP